MTKTPVGLILLLWGAGLGAAAQYAKVSVIFDQLPDVYPDAGAALGFAVSLVGFIGIIFGVVAGLLVARIRYRRALLWALWLGAVVSALQSFLPSFEWFLVLHGIEGLSHLAMVVAAPTLTHNSARRSTVGFPLRCGAPSLALLSLYWHGVACHLLRPMVCLPCLQRTPSIWLFLR